MFDRRFTLELYFKTPQQQARSSTALKGYHRGAPSTLNASLSFGAANMQQSVVVFEFL